MDNIEIAGNHGFATLPAGGVLTFEIQGVSEREDIRARQYESIYSRFACDSFSMRLGNYTVPFWGDGHNLYPQEVFATVNENKLLPGVIEKQEKFLFGKGPRLYTEIVEGEGKDSRRVRIPVEEPEIQTWLDAWENYGFDHYWDYLRNLIIDYYHVKTCVSKYNFNKSRRINGAIPIVALSHIGADEARLATLKNNIRKRLHNNDCNYVVVGDWLNPSVEDYKVFNRFNPAEPFKHSVAIAFNADKTFSKWVYALNNWFGGLYEWIKASNLSPRYLNSYLKNALNAHVHVKIPGMWYNNQKSILQSVCEENLRAEKNAIQAQYRGVVLVTDAGNPLRFNESMMNQLITNELRLITGMLSGEGKNQGKLYATTKWGDEGWEFEDFPGKFKEYFDAVISLDKRADQVILAGKGISSSITNVENDGVISKSGSDVYYNYLIYVASLTLDEHFVCKEINRAIKLNFPHKKNIKLGFWIDVPAKMQDTTPAERLQNTATPEAAKTE